jgi:hypothetical protein
MIAVLNDHTKQMKYVDSNRLTSDESCNLPGGFDRSTDNRKPGGGAARVLCAPGMIRVLMPQSVINLLRLDPAKKSRAIFTSSR